MRYTTILLALVLVLGAGCQTAGPGVHTIPVTRDYDHLEKVKLDSAAESVREAHRLGAASAAPYEYFSALQYLGIAREQARLGDRQAMWDYAGLAKEMGEAAVHRCGAEPGAAKPAAPSGSLEECQAKFKEVKAAYLELDRDKAVECAPVVYASLTATLSRAEHDLNYDWHRADEALDFVKADLDAIRGQDGDQDGVPDMQDAEPRLAEDFDNFEDGDGAPDFDNDRDGVPDKSDVKPMEPETVNGYKDEDGAPDELPKLDTVGFVEGKSELTGEAKGYLRGVKQLLDEWPRLRLRVTGLANAAAAESEAMDLSRQRAENVGRYLLDEGVPERQLVVTFQGSAEAGGGAAGVELRLE